jgi:hypothetical protein
MILRPFCFNASVREQSSRAPDKASRAFSIAQRIAQVLAVLQVTSADRHPNRAFGDRRI